MNKPNSTDATITNRAPAPKKPIFQNPHYDAIADLLGEKVLYGMMDKNDYRIIEAFSEMFAQDNPTTFDIDRFRDAVYEAHSRRKVK
jgi:hypothetical protein